MDIQVSKWGNSLAMRLPSEIARKLGVTEGDTLDAQITIDGGLSLRPASWSRAAFAAELNEARASLPVGSSVIEELRRGARY
jgi:antitoxin MazE